MRKVLALCLCIALATCKRGGAQQRPQQGEGVPVTVAQLLVGGAENLLHFAGKSSPIQRATLDKFTEDVAVSSAKIQAQLDYQPLYDLASGWQNVVRV